MSRIENTDSFREEQALRRRQRNARMRRRKRKIRRVRRLIRIVCIGAFVCLFWVARQGVLSENQTLPLPIIKENIPKKNATKKFSKQKVVKPKRYNEDEIHDTIETMAQTSKKYQKVYSQMEQYPKELLLGLCNNKEMLDFVVDYPGKSSASNYRFTSKELEDDFPLLIQWDKRWGYESYGNSCVGISGCAPTCMSMVVLALTGNKEATPKNLAKFADENGYYVEGTGTLWSFLTEGASHFGIKGRELSLSQTQIAAELENGHPIICSMAPGDFTTQGHFIVLVGTQNGKIIVNDPNSRGRSNVLWDFSKLQTQIKNLWVYSA